MFWTLLFIDVGNSHLQIDPPFDERQEISQKSKVQISKTVWVHFAICTQEKLVCLAQVPIQQPFPLAIALKTENEQGGFGGFDKRCFELISSHHIFRFARNQNYYVIQSSIIQFQLPLNSKEEAIILVF